MTQDTRPTGAPDSPPRRDVTIPTAEGAIIARPIPSLTTREDVNATIAALLAITVEDLLTDPFAGLRKPQQQR